MNLRTLIIEAHPEEVGLISDVPEAVLEGLYPDLSCWKLDYERLPKLIDAWHKLFKIIEEGSHSGIDYAIQKLKPNFWLKADLSSLQSVLFDKANSEGRDLVMKIHKTFWMGNTNITRKTQDNYSTAYSLLMTLAVFYAIEKIPEALVLLSENQKMAMAELEKDFYAMMNMFETRVQNSKKYPTVTI